MSERRSLTLEERRNAAMGASIFGETTSSTGATRPRSSRFIEYTWRKQERGGRMGWDVARLLPITERMLLQGTHCSGREYDDEKSF